MRKPSTKSPKRPKAVKKGRPFVTDPAVTYADKSYIVTTFRLSKAAVAQADTLDEYLQLGSRTAAVQYALGEVFQRIRQHTTPMGRPVMKVMNEKLGRLERGTSGEVRSKSKAR